MTYLQTALAFLPFSAIAAAILYLPLAILLHVKRKPYPFIRHFANYLLIGYLIALIYVTFFWASTNIPLTLDERLHLLPRLDSNPFLGCKALLNVQISPDHPTLSLLFMPLGGLLPCVFSPLRKGAWKTVLICFLLSLCIEFLQFFIGRVADMDDLICNTLGGVFGRALYTAAAWAFKKVKAFEPILTDHAKTPGHVAALIAMMLILIVPTAVDLVNAALPYGLFPIAG